MVSKLVLGISGLLFTITLVLILQEDISGAGLPMVAFLVLMALYGYVNKKFKRMSFTFWVFAFLAAAMYYPFLFTDWGFNTKVLVIPMLQLIMFGMGTKLSLNDFKTELSKPKGIIIGSIMAFGFMPVIGVFLVKLFNFPPDIAVGIILIGCCPGYDPSNRHLSSKGMRLLLEGYENARDAIGWDHDLLIGCHWEFDLRTSIDLARGLESVKPLWLEDPLPVPYTESWKRLVDMSPVPICTGENWMRRSEALPFIKNAATDIIHPDLRNSGGFLENKRMADLYSLPVANHNSGSIVNGMASVNWGSTIRNYLFCETMYFDGRWVDDIIIHDGPLCKNGYVTVPDKPGLGIDLNPDVVKANLVPGEVWWG